MELLNNYNEVEKLLLQKAKQNYIPMNGSIELLPLCNMKCDMCYVRLTPEEMKTKGRIRTADEWLDIGRQMKEAGTLFLLLTGGEPLLYPEFKKVYLGLKQMGMIITINSNGTLMNDEWFDFFAEHKPRRINITLYGPDEETYDQLCHYREGYKKARNAIHTLKSKGIDVVIGHSITPQNINYISRMVAIAKEEDCPIAIDHYMMPSPRERELPYPMQARVSPEEAASARMEYLRSINDHEKLANYAREMVKAVDSYNPPENIEQLSCFQCMAGNCSYTINWQGNIRPCVVAHEPSYSVFEHGFRGAWELMRNAISGLCMEPKCAGCHYKPICKTCGVASLLENGAYKGAPEYLCAYSEELYKLLKKECNYCS